MIEAWNRLRNLRGKMARRVGREEINWGIYIHTRGLVNKIHEWKFMHVGGEGPLSPACTLSYTGPLRTSLSQSGTAGS
jgi:hypothetical protein